ncbi:MAG: sodium:solute symporter family protein [Pirellulales bacterium]|nr:sodium:solute symporter family protein [Pirellulales bacterium]
MLGIKLVDWLVIGAYLLGITAIGTWAMRRVKSSTSFFISDRRFGKLMMIFFAFGTGTHGDQAVTVASKSYRDGASGIWYQWLWLFCTPFYWFIAPMMRRMRAVTIADFFEVRFNRSVALLFAVIGILNLSVNIGTMLKGASAMVTAVSGGAIGEEAAMIAMTVMFVVYGVAGGLNAAIVTDFVQGLLTIVLSFLILPFALVAVGGISGMKETIGRPEMFDLAAAGGDLGQITVFYILMIALNGLIGYATQPHSYSISGAGKTEMECRVGLAFGNFIKRICTVAWMLTGLCAIALLGPGLKNPDQAYGLMADELLPGVAPGLVGLFIASLLAAVMSSCDAFMVAASALFTENIYRPHLVRNRSDRHYTLVGRIAAILVVVAGISFAFSLDSVIDGLEVFWKISAMMGIAFWVGLFWRRTTTAGAWAGTLVGFAAWLFTSKIAFGSKVLWDFNARFAHLLPNRWEIVHYNDGSPELNLPWQMVFYLTAGLVATVVVSLLTRPVDPERLERVYTCLRTPIGPDETEAGPFNLSPGVAPGPRRVVLDFAGLEIPRMSFVGLIGFLGCWAFVGAIIGVVYWIFS